jgi:hypothetical protein
MVMDQKAPTGAPALDLVEALFSCSSRPAR